MMQDAQIHAQAARVLEPAPHFRLFRPNLPALALGLAVDHLMSKPAFARLQFGDWARVLAGQVNRKQCCFAVDQNNRILGFAGWALTERDKAEDWISGRDLLLSADSRHGDCVLFNAWSAETREVHDFMFARFRKKFADKRSVYFRRHYRDGRTRSVRLSVNHGKFDGRPIERLRC